jgi:hypothetical protein
MISRKGKRNVSFESDFNFRFENEITRRRSPIIRIDPRFENDDVQTSFAGRRDKDIPYEVSNPRGQLRLPRTYVDDTRSSVT